MATSLLTNSHIVCSWLLSLSLSLFISSRSFSLHRSRAQSHHKFSCFLPDQLVRNLPFLLIRRLISHRHLLRQHPHLRLHFHFRYCCCCLVQRCFRRSFQHRLRVAAAPQQLVVPNWPQQRVAITPRARAGVRLRPPRVQQRGRAVGTQPWTQPRHCSWQLPRRRRPTRTGSLRQTPRSCRTPCRLRGPNAGRNRAIGDAGSPQAPVRSPRWNRGRGLWADQRLHQLRHQHRHQV